MKNDLITSLRPAAVMTILFAVVLGVIYPILMTIVGQTVFPHQANGSLIRDGDKVIGSELIGQNFAAARYFHGRPSAAGKGYDATASSGSNYGPTSQALIDRVRGDIKTLAAEHPGRPIPADLVTASGSGLDPEITPEAAEWQVDRVARARGIDAAAVRKIVASETREPVLGFIGEPRVNVLALNRRLDAQAAGRKD